MKVAKILQTIWIKWNFDLAVFDLSMPDLYKDQANPILQYNVTK